MRCRGILGIDFKYVLAALVTGFLFLPPAGEATETSSAQSAAQTQETESAPDAGTTDGSGQAGDSQGDEKKEGETEEEPDC